MNLNSEYWSLGLCRKVGFMLFSRHDTSSTCICLFRLAFLGRSQHLPFWTFVSKSMMGFFSRYAGFCLIRSVWMVRDGKECHLSYLARQGLTQFPRRGIPQVKWQPLCHSQWLLLGLKTSNLDYGLGGYDKLSIALREIPFYHRGLHSGFYVICRMGKILWDKMLIH